MSDKSYSNKDILPIDFSSSLERVGGDKSFLMVLQEASFQMEMAGKERDIEKAKKALSRLEQEFKRLKDFLSPK